MKKIFTLIAALALTAAAATAQTFTFIHTMPDGTQTELEEGASYSVGYTPDEFAGITTYEWNAQLSLRFETVVTQFIYEVTVENAPEGFTAKTCPAIGIGACYELTNNTLNSYKFTDRMETDEVANLDLEGATNVTPTAPVTFKIRVFEEGYEEEGASCTVVFHPSDIAGVDHIAADNSNAPVEYYNLQGIRVNNPAQGQLLLRRQGTDVAKTLVP